MKRALAICALMLPALAHADDAAEARFFDELGRTAYARGRYDEAIVHFLAAQEAAPSVRTLYNLALCAQAAHRREAAFVWLDEYLRGADDDAARRADAERRMATLRRSLAIVTVTSQPPGAIVYVDRRELGEWGRTPRSLVLDAGAHEIELELDGHRLAHVNVTAAVGEEREASATLEPRVGRLRVDANARAAVVVARGDREVAHARSGTEIAVPIGAYDVRVEAPEHQPETLEVRVTEGALERRRVTLAPAPPPSGRLLVATGDVHARLFVDGRPVAETPAALNVRGGERRIELRAPGRLTWRAHLRVNSGRSRYLNVTLVPER